jgi:hypothetical protein
MKLEPREIATPLWQKLRAHITDELQTLRLRNDRYRPEAETIRLRARIEQLNLFLAMENPEPEQEIAAGE